MLIIIFKSTTPGQDFQRKVGNQWGFGAVEQKATIFFAPLKKF